MHKGAGFATLLVSMACLTACKEAVPPTPSIASPVSAVQTTVVTRPPVSSATIADSRLMSAVAQDAADRADRQQTLRVQKLLRDQARQHKLTSDAIQRGDGSERCMDGHKLRKVANGWEQAGAC